jgi:hypothetical protein
MASFSSLASMSARPAWPNIWCGGGFLPRRDGGRSFRNHADGIAAMDLFVVPTISFRLLYGLLIMGHGRRKLLWVGVTAHPTTEWIARLAAGSKSLAT